VADSLPRRTAGDHPRVRVLHLVINLDVGGLERVVVNHVRFADRTRFDLAVLCLGSEGRLAPELRAIGVPVCAMAVHGPHLVRALIRLVGELRRWKPHVLHTHDFPPHLLGAPAARLARVPVVIHTRHCQTGALTRRQALGLRISSWLSTMVVAVSEDSGRLLGSREGVPSRKRRVIQNGVDVSAYHARHRWSRPPGQRVISVGRLAEVKDYPTLLRAARRVAESLPDFRLEIVGDGPARASLEALRSDLGLSGCVSFLGERGDVAERLASADVFALASTSEGLSVSLLEAMAAGLPIVATCVGGNPEIVTSGVTGELVPPGNVEALASALLSMLADPIRLASMARAARLRAEEQFDLRRVVARYEALYVQSLAAVGCSVLRPGGPG
jgi:glycosyltransferase involved in cell wall biosynthesis